MHDPERCLERAQECRRKAELMSSPRDRAHWLKLAEDWMAFSRIQFLSGSNTNKMQAPRTELWRGEFAGYGTH
jgi:hypothetical protein